MTSLVTAALLHALAIAESGNRLDAVGDNGLAHGPYQMHAEAIAETSWGNKRPVTQAEWDDCAAQYLRKLEKKYGFAYQSQITDPKTLVMVWNMGLNGYMEGWKRSRREMKAVWALLARFERAMSKVKL